MNVLAGVSALHYALDIVMLAASTWLTREGYNTFVTARSENDKTAEFVFALVTLGGALTVLLISGMVFWHLAVDIL